MIIVNITFIAFFQGWLRELPFQKFIVSARPIVTVVRKLLFSVYIIEILENSNDRRDVSRFRSCSKMPYQRLENKFL